MMIATSVLLMMILMMILIGIVEYTMIKRDRDWTENEAIKSLRK